MKPTAPGNGQTQGTSLTSEEKTPSAEAKKGKMAHTSVEASEASATKKTGVKRKLSESESVTNRAVALPVTDPNFYRSANSLFEALFQETGVERSPFQLYPIGGSDIAAVVSRAPDIDHAVSFWNVFRQSGCRVILNINHDGAGEDYFPGPKQVLNLGELEIIREDIPDSEFLMLFKDKRARADSERPCEHMSVTVSGRVSLKAELYRIKDWQDGDGYDPRRAIAIARLLPLGETLVHCLAGLGRTGTIVTIMQLVDLADNSLLVPEKAVETLVGFIKGNRFDREDSRFVTSVAQFNCLLQVVQILTGLSEDEINTQVQEVVQSQS